MPADLDRAVLLQVERDLERFGDRLDELVEGSDEVTQSQLNDLYAAVERLADQVRTLESSVKVLRRLMDELLRA